MSSLDHDVLTSSCFSVEALKDQEPDKRAKAPPGEMVLAVRTTGLEMKGMIPLGPILIQSTYST